MSIVDPLSVTEARVLCTYVRQLPPEVPEHERAEWAAATDSLVTVRTASIIGRAASR
jgi:hypothetical protein